MHKNNKQKNLERYDFKGIWIPKEIWLNDDLSWFEKMLLMEIHNLNKTDVGCFASNSYLADFFGYSVKRIESAVSTLKKLGYVYTISFDGRTRYLGTNLTPKKPSENDKETKKSATKSTKKDQDEGSQKCDGSGENENPQKKGFSTLKKKGHSILDDITTNLKEKKAGNPATKNGGEFPPQDEFFSFAENSQAQGLAGRLTPASAGTKGSLDPNPPSPLPKADAKIAHRHYAKMVRQIKKIVDQNQANAEDKIELQRELLSLTQNRRANRTRFAEISNEYNIRPDILTEILMKFLSTKYEDRKISSINYLLSRGSKEHVEFVLANYQTDQATQELYDSIDWDKELEDE